MPEPSEQRGYTLLEMLAVGVLLVVLATLAVPAVLRTIDRTRIEAAKTNLLLLRSALNRYHAAQATGASNGHYPLAHAAPTPPILSEADLEARMGSSYWTRPGSAQYAFVAYTTDATGQAFTLCLRADDGRPADANGGPGTLVKIDARGEITEDTGAAQAPVGTFCAVT